MAVGVRCSVRRNETSGNIKKRCHKYYSYAGSFSFCDVVHGQEQPITLRVQKKTTLNQSMYKNHPGNCTLESAYLPPDVMFTLGMSPKRLPLDPYIINYQESRSFCYGFKAGDQFAGSRGGLM